MNFEGAYKSHTVYGVKFKENMIYIGQTSQHVKSRIYRHFGNAFGKSIRHKNLCPKFYEFLRKNPNKDDYTITIFSQCGGIEANQLEMQLIKDYKTREIGCNVAPGGNNPSNSEHYLYGKKVSRHIVEASVAARIGKPLTEEHKAALRAGHAKNKLKSKRIKPIRCIQTGQEWVSISDCAKFFDVDASAVNFRINRVLSRNRKNEKLKNFTFEYKEIDCVVQSIVRV